MFPILLLETVRVLSGVASFASKYDSSKSFSFRDVTFFVTFSKKFQKTQSVTVISVFQ